MTGHFICNSKCDFHFWNKILYCSKLYLIILNYTHCKQFCYSYNRHMFDNKLRINCFVWFKVFLDRRSWYMYIPSFSSFTVFTNRSFVPISLGPAIRKTQKSANPLSLFFLPCFYSFLALSSCFHWVDAGVLWIW